MTLRDLKTKASPLALIWLPTPFLQQAEAEGALPPYLLSSPSSSPTLSGLWTRLQHTCSRQKRKKLEFFHPNKVLGIIFQKSLGGSRVQIRGSLVAASPRQLWKRPELSQVLSTHSGVKKDMLWPQSPHWGCPSHGPLRSPEASPHLAAVGRGCPWACFTLMSRPLSAEDPPPSACNGAWLLHVNSEIKSKFQFTNVNYPCDPSKWDKFPAGYFSWKPGHGLFTWGKALLT